MRFVYDNSKLTVFVFGFVNWYGHHYNGMNLLSVIVSVETVGDIELLPFKIWMQLTHR